MKSSIANATLVADEFFMKSSPIHDAAMRLAKRLNEMEMPFAIAGALAVNAHGHKRLTADVDILLRKEDLTRFKDRWLGLGWVDKFEGSRGVRDTVSNIGIDILLTGDFPGDGLEKPVAFPDPRHCVELDEDGVPILILSKVIELKLASAMTAPDRPRDYDDVIQLIRINELPREYGADLNPYVHEDWYRMWDASRHKDEY